MRRAGPADGVLVILLHGGSYNKRGYDANGAAADRRRVRARCARYGPTRFLCADRMRSDEQAALGNDLKEMMDALVRLKIIPTKANTGFFATNTAVQLV
jgi:hypothetical protein